MSDVAKFLETVYGHGSGWIHLSTLNQQVAAVKCSEVGDLAETIDGRKDVFLSAAVIGTDKGSGGAGRIEDADAVQLTALWVDLDRAGEPGHKTAGPHWTREDMGRLLEHLPIAPTGIIDSGGGWWPWFAVDEPVPLNGDGSGELLLARWRDYWETIQETFGRHVDLGVFNAGRIARAPGSINNKDNIPRPAVVKSLFPERRYTQADLEGFLPYPKPDPAPVYDWNGHKTDDEKPGDTYNREATQESSVSLLLAHGFHSPKRVGGRVDLTRPGKNGREGSSVSVYPDAGATFFSSSPEGQPGAVSLRDKGGARGSYDPFGLYAALEHGGDFQAAARTLNPPSTVVIPQSEARLQPVDLNALMSADPPEVDWLVEPFLPARKHTGIVSKRGEGKSILLLDVAARRAAGQATLEQPAGPPAHIVYIDQEMGPDDLWERLNDLGWTSDNPNFGTLVEHLHYYQLVDLPPLDTEAGGQALEEIVDRHGATLVIIDTVSRVISGNENDSDSFRELFRHTETRLKRRGVTLARLDHLGKDATKGSRGSSAKEDALDVVWQLTIGPTGTILLTLTKGRQAWIPNTVVIHRETRNGTVSHVIPDKAVDQWTMDLVYEIDQLELPDDAGVNTVQKALKATGNGRRRLDISNAVKIRKHRSQTVPETREPPGNHSGNHSGNHPEPPVENTLLPGETDGNHPGNHPEPSKGVGSPPSGEPPQTCPDCDLHDGRHSAICPQLPDPFDFEGRP